MKNLLPKNFSSVSKRRRVYGLTQRHLASIVGTSPAAIAEIETGKRPLTEKMSKRIDAAFAEYVREPTDDERAAMKRAVDVIFERRKKRQRPAR